MDPLTDDEVASRSSTVFRKILEMLPSCQERDVEPWSMNVLRTGLVVSLKKMNALIDSIKDDPNLEPDKDQERAAKQSCATSGGTALNAPTTAEVQHLVQTGHRLSGIIERLEFGRTSTMLSTLDDQSPASDGDREPPDRASSRDFMDEFDTVLAFTMKVLAKERRPCIVHADCWLVSSKYKSVRAKLESLLTKILDASPWLRNESLQRVPIFMEAPHVPSSETYKHS